uniref:ABC transporter domain-containing protein n=1 Tax=Acrobeloides nanus TaxID=290746 RepID=A0A914BW66_9BILA
MGILRQVGLLLRKDFKLIQRGIWAFILEMLFGILGAVLVTLLLVFIISGNMFQEDSGLNFNSNYNNPALGILGTYAIRGIKYDDFACLKQIATGLDVKLVDYQDQLNNTNYNIYYEYIDVVDYNLNSENLKLKYQVVYIYGDSSDISSSWWNNGNPWPTIWSGHYSSTNDYTFDGDGGYDISSVQYVFDQIFIHAAKIKNNQNGSCVPSQNLQLESIAFSPMPMPGLMSWKSRNLYGLLDYITPMWALFTLLPIIYTIKEVLAEKEAGVKTYLMAMGMRPGVFYLSHFIFAIIKMNFIMVILNLAVTIYLIGNYGWIIMILGLLYGFCAASFALLISTLFQRSSFAYIVAIVIWVASMGLCVLPFIGLVKLDTPWLCAIISLNPTQAFCLAVNTLAAYATYGKGINFFATLPYFYSMGAATLMLLFDGLVMLLLTFYLDLVLPTDDSPKQSPFFFLKWCLPKKDKVYPNNKSFNGKLKNGIVVDEDSEFEENSRFQEYMESEENMTMNESDIEVQGLVKKWKTGEVAVRGISFRGYKNQVTVLLGHNGAGKSKGINFFATLPYFYSMGAATLMLLFDGLVMLLLTFYLDLVLPTDDSPKQSPFFFLKWCLPKKDKVYPNNKSFNGKLKNGILVDEESEFEENSRFQEYMESEENMTMNESDIEVQGLVKKWKTGEVAVRGISFRGYKNQVTVLLGHNGAGKKNLVECQRQLGYCPQFNPLFAKLTVRDHLWFYGNLKLDQTNGVTDEEINEVIRQIGLKGEENKQAAQLSGGMKRKLCVGMALIGQSKVILLDEPTAGMDPNARHQISYIMQDIKKDRHQISYIMQDIKKDRTVLLTTHYMDEASVMGDRIAIMAKGDLICNGTTEFLRKKFGAGYILTVSLETSQYQQNFEALDTQAEKILKVVQKQCQNARFDGAISQQFKILLPDEDKQKFAELFEELENNKHELAIHSFGLSANTLEQVFLRVGEIADPQPENGNHDHIATYLCNEQQVRKSGINLLLWQILALFKRYYLYHLRHWLRILIPFIVIGICLGLLYATNNAFGNNTSSDYNQEKQKYFSLNNPNLPKFTLPIKTNGFINDSENCANYANQIPHAHLLHFSDKEDLLKHAFDLPPPGFGLWYNGTTMVGLFQQEFKYGRIMSMNLISNILAGNNRIDSITVGIHINPKDQSINHDYDNEEENNDGPNSQGTLAAMLLTVGATLLMSTFIFPLITEKKTRFKHQLLLTRLHPIIYWAVQIIGDLGFYIIGVILITICICVHPLYIWKFSDGAGIIITMWIVYFWSCLSLTYCFSYLFSSEIKGYCFLLAWHFIVPLLFTFIYMVLYLIVTLISKSDTLHTVVLDILVGLLVFLFPSYGLMSNAIQITIRYGTDPSYDHTGNFVPFARTMTIQAISGLVYSILLTLIQSSSFANFVNQRFRQQSPPHVEITDPDVLNEKNWVEREPVTLALRVKNLCKFYKTKCAVKGISFGVREIDCFGLLGVNGAGKTTTFDMLTGLTLPSSGTALINGIDVLENPPIGYCPQFDALSPDLTGHETLMLIGKLNGITRAEERVDAVLESLQMAHLGGKLVKHYSGGQKRRISIGVALMANSRLIFLDEPTAGVDPRTRRHLWDLLTSLRKNGIAILLTSHSMEECEALCTRIGFMNDGVLLSIGTSQTLKDRYGDHFILTLTVSNPKGSIGAFLNQIVIQEFQALPTREPLHMSTITWEIPKRPDISWSRLYWHVMHFVQRFPVSQQQLPEELQELPIIQDFSLVQSSLEQVFVSMSRFSTNENVIR